MEKITLELFILVWRVYLTLSDSAGSDQNRAKRVVNGLPLDSHESYNTHFFVDLVHTYACTSDQFDHSLKDCEFTHVCGGALIQPDFVLTACHCITYEIWYSNEWWRPLPPVPTILPDDVPDWIDERFNKDALSVFDILFKHRRAKHPLLNAMTMWAGSTHRNDAPQRRHAAVFFPHHLCMQRQKDYFTNSTWNNTMYEMDIGLIKSCEPFKVNKDVKLAHLPAYETMESLMNKILTEARVCLFAGWGYSLVPGSPMFPRDEQVTEVPEILQHIFRYVECHEECLSYYVCAICSIHHGPIISHMNGGDSGSPIVCDGLVVAVHSATYTKYERNVTSAVAIPVACVKESLTTKHLDFLRRTNEEAFHWLNGRPVTPKADGARYKFRALSQLTGQMPSTSPRKLSTLSVTVFQTIFILWSQSLYQS